MPLHIESAYMAGNHIGWRLTVGGDSMLVWKDQDILRGFRVGERFVPGMGEVIEYRECEVVERRDEVRR